MTGQTNTDQTNQKNELAADDFFFIANQLLDFYQTVSAHIQSPNFTKEEKMEIYEQSKSIIQLSYEFQRMGFKSLCAKLNVSAEELKRAVANAAAIIKTHFVIGKCIEITADIIAIGSILAVPVLKPTSLLALPELLTELVHDVNDLTK
ncbi:MAG: hypothetical protein V1816_04245 [Pseudomonadota bacterium]